MSRRRSDGRYARNHPKAFIIGTWTASFLSLGLLYASALAVKSEFAMLRSCNGNTDGLSIHSCGKQALNIGDLVLVGLFLLSAVLVVTLFTAAIRLVRRSD